MQPLLASDPAQVGDYRLLGRLGRGAMGGVYLGRSRGGRVVAVKVVRPDLAEDPEFRERFRREAHAARSVGGFWTAAVVHADPDAEQPWMASEYVPGPTLHQAVVEYGPLPEPTVRSLGAGLAEALAAIHRAGLVHRDLKPANVLLGPDGPRVIDFGISRAMTGNALTATGIFLGTPGYFSPEQTQGREVGPPSDVFSLGAVLVFAATGVGPFGDDSLTALMYRVVHEEADLAKVPGELRPLLADCLNKDPAARPTPAEMLDRIGETSPQGSQWLPSPITAVIAQHATQLQETSNAPRPEPGPPASPHAAPGKPLTVAPLRDKIVPARQHHPTQHQQAELAVRGDGPGPAFSTGGRVRAALWAVVFFLLTVGSVRLADRIDFGATQEQYALYHLGQLLLAFGIIVSLVRVVAPRLRLKVNGDGLLVSRLHWQRSIPWQRVKAVSVVGSGKKAAVAVWFTDGTVLSSEWWHHVRRYHGGGRIFPVGAGVGWMTRRQEVRRIRTALDQYAQGRYDPRLL